MASYDQVISPPWTRWRHHGEQGSSAGRFLAAVAALAMALGPLAGCGEEEAPGCPPPTVPEVVSPWGQATVPYDAPCGDACVPLLEGALGGGAELRVVVNPTIDDPVTRWADCLQGIMRCVDAGEEPGACVAEAPCPSVCQEHYRVRATHLNDPDDQLDEIERVFVHEGAPCRPVPGEGRP